MTGSVALATPDSLSETLVHAARDAAALLVIPRAVSRKRLAPFYESNAASLRHFNNEKELAAESRRLREVAGQVFYQRARAAVAKIFGGIAIGPADFPVELTLATNQSRFGIRDDSLGQIVRIDENEVSASTLAKLLDAYSPLPSDQRPLIIIESHDNGSDITRRLEQVPEAFAVAKFGDHDRLLELIIERVPSESISQLVDQYSENAFSPVARVSSQSLIEQIPADEPLSTLIATRLLHMRAVASERGKFDTMFAAQALAAHMELRKDALATQDAKVLLAGKVLTNLWLLYCQENERGLFDNSMAIAQGLEDELIQAHCLRMINTVHPHSAFTEHCSRRAADIFFQRGMYDYANYCLNNALVGRFYTDRLVATEFGDVIEASAANLSGFRGLAIMMNNAGVAHMIEGRPAEAILWFERAAKEPSWPLHRFGASVNALFARYLEGENPNSDELVKLARAIDRQVDARYRHQIAHMLLNLYSLAREDAAGRSEILVLLNARQLLNDHVVLNDRTTLASLAVRLGLAAVAVEPHPGLRGRFIERYDFVPGFHHTWL